MSKFLRFKSDLRSHRWDEAAERLAEAPDLADRADANGRTLVGYAMQDGRWDEASWLLLHGASIFQAAWGWLKSDPELTIPAELERAMAERCANQFKPSDSIGEESILEVAIQSGRASIALALASKPWGGDEAGWSRAWFCAVRRFDSSICDAMGQQSDGARTPALIELAAKALKHGRLDALDWLSDHGLVCSGRNGKGETLLCLAVQGGERGGRCLPWLLARVRDPDEMDSSHHTPLYYAVARGLEDKARLLMESGANPDLRQGKNGQGASPLRLANKQGARALRQLLVPPLERALLLKDVAPEAGAGARRTRL